MAAGYAFPQYSLISFFAKLIKHSGIFIFRVYWIEIYPQDVLLQVAKLCRKLFFYKLLKVAGMTD